MLRKIIQIEDYQYLPLIGFEKKAYNSIKKHFGLSNFQILVLCWLKGLWTGILICLVLHHFISH